MRWLLAISTDTTAFPWRKRTPIHGLRASIAVALALLIGALTGHESAGAIAAGSAFTIGFATFHEALSSSLLSMALLTLGIASATLAGSLGAQWTPVVLVLAAIAAINYGLLSCLGPTAGWMGQQCAVFVIVASYFSQGLRYAEGRTLMVLAGGALQMIVFAVFAVLDQHHRSPRKLALLRRFPKRVAELWREVLQQFHPKADTVSYILRLAIALLLCTWLYRHYHVRNGYWSPMTAVLVLKPQWTDTLSRGIARLVGTLAGAGIALLMARTVPLHPAVVVALVIVAAWGCYALQAVNYAAFSLCITLFIVFSFRFGGFSQTDAAHIRLYNTAFGGIVALLIDAAWKLFTPRSDQPRKEVSFTAGDTPLARETRR